MIKAAVNNCFSVAFDIQRIRQPQQSTGFGTLQQLLLLTSKPAECRVTTINKIQRDFSLSFFKPSVRSLEWRVASEPRGISNPQTNLLNLCASPPINPVCPCANCFHMPNKSIVGLMISFTQLSTHSYISFIETL